MAINRNGKVTGDLSRHFAAVWDGRFAAVWGTYLEHRQVSNARGDDRTPYPIAFHKFLLMALDEPPLDLDR